MRQHLGIPAKRVFQVILIYQPASDRHQLRQGSITIQGIHPYLQNSLRRHHRQTNKLYTTKPNTGLHDAVKNIKTWVSEHRGLHGQFSY